MERETICKGCGSIFINIIGIGTGKTRLYCTTKCRDKHERIKWLATLPKCKIPECNRKSRGRQGLCETHYYRLRRTGSTDDRVLNLYTITEGGYKALPKRVYKNHPLACSNGYLLEHRKVLYDKYGDGDQECFWCGTMLTWKQIKGDHLDENKLNNAIDNLVISCNTCNRARGAMLHLIKRIQPDKLPIFIETIKKYNEKCHARERRN